MTRLSFFVFALPLSLASQPPKPPFPIIAPPTDIMPNIFGGGLFGGGGFFEGMRFANGQWKQHNDPVKITITGELPKDTDPTRVFAEAHGSELVVSMEERSIKRQQKGDQAAVGSKEEKSFERKFTLPFEFEDKDINIKTEGQQVTIEVPVPKGVVVEASDQQPESSMSSFSYSADGPGLAGGLRHMSAFSSSPQGFPDISKLFGPGFGNGPHSFSPLAALLSPFLNQDPFMGGVGYNQDAQADSLKRQSEGGTTPPLAGPSLLNQLDQGFMPGPVIPMAHPFVHGMPSFFGPLGFGAVPNFRGILEMPSLGDWQEEKAADGAVVISGTIPKDISLDKVQVVASGNRLLVKDETQSDQVPHQIPSRHIGLFGGISSHKESRIFHLPFQVTQDMVKVDKNPDTSKVTITVSAPKKSEK